MVQPLSVDSSQTVIFPSLISGGTLHVISEDRASDAEALSDYVCRLPIDLLKIAPSHLAALLISSHPEQVLPRHWLVIGGEASRREWVEKIQAMGPCSILNHYGPTEATVGMLTYQSQKNRNSHGSLMVPIGRPLPNTQVYLLDRYLQPVPIGVVGELHIGGSCLARGYLNRSELTAEKFIPNPFSKEPGSRLYKTGDLARYRSDGNIEFLGRVDHQVKIRGFRIELGEIEVGLAEHPDVRETVVLAREDEAGKKCLVAYIVPCQFTKAKLDGWQPYKLPNNLMVAQLNKNETDYMYREIFELQAYLKHGITIKDGDCVFDVGANIGLFTIFVNQICRQPKIYAFEPNPVVFEILSANAKAHGPEAKLFNHGLSGENKMAELTFFQGFSMLSGFYADAETEKSVVKTFLLNQQKKRNVDMTKLIQHADELLEERFAAKSFTVQLQTLSSVIAEENVPYIDLLKINVEKSELDVLRGITDEDWKKIRQIVMEVDVEENLTAIVSLLEQQGYELVVEQDVLLEQTQLRYVYAIRPSGDRQLLRDQVKDAHLHQLPVWSDMTLLPRELERHLRQRLPDYMVPSQYVLLEALPLTPNGKVDRRAFPGPDRARPELEKTFAAPRTPVEAVLARIWAEVLKLEQVGVYDNFFQLGGDSILSIQIIARANQAGLRLTPKQLFQHQTIAELALVAGTAPTTQAEQHLVIGSVPLTPIQHWFFEQNPSDPHYYNQAVLLEVRQALEPALLERVVHRLLLHHDALRLRFVRLESGWQQVIADSEESSVFSHLDLSPLPEANQGTAIASVASELQASLNLSEGPLLRVALFDLGPHQPARLLMIVHHLAVDGVSWRIMLQDLQTACQQLGCGEAIKLPPKTTSFKQWVKRLRQVAQSAILQQELTYWLTEKQTFIPLPLDYPGGTNIETSARVVSVSLSGEETRSLLQEVPAAYRTHINDVLLTAMVQAFARWTGVQSLLIDLEGPGREEISEGVDLSRTVGWFTTRFPLLLNLDGISHPGEALKLIKEQLRRIPNSGIGYGLLRYLSEDGAVARRLQALPQPEVSFNYLGQFDQVLPMSSPFAWAGESIGSPRSLRERRRDLLAVNGRISGGRLQMNWTYGEKLHRRTSIEYLAQAFIEALRALITHCQSPDAGGYTPSDFPLAKLNQQQLDKIITKLSEA
jgi:non-ribosomal peptide synthase protein (TIGR01720 family)/FkbM family methyltransferase